MSQTDFRTQTRHLRFSGLIQWGHLRQAFQGPFCPWEGLVVPKRTESFVWWLEFYSGAGASVDGPGSVSCLSAYCVLWYVTTSLVLSGLPAAGLWYRYFLPSPHSEMVLALHPKISCSLANVVTSPGTFSS